ncbi:ATP-binding protein [Streptomyces sp. P9(2023)]|uniref:ATP-binding protein n=1 Tax=Streptomyces sp. P9(2023) TaxID=3064394 RepID=UPI0028F3EA5A|nr:ATP-binding protein [Streptomyces sp. P9(2023)]MDT9690230.1 ATP-binding protein [Streptomyces sp. P9(2023)]
MERQDCLIVMRWRRGPKSVPLARRALRKALGTWGLPAIEDAASLILSELLTNAVRHARVPGRSIETRFLLMPDGLRIEVHDASEQRPLMALPDDDAGGGWGLPLVDTLSAKWGVSDRSGPGKLVWAELATDEPEGRSAADGTPPAPGARTAARS